ncbi:hypothetical protein SORBI_3003G180200 [Sorghum bicolor]|uniref:Uncharacterized protein n=1 Tax=Sorghum bicolor TaxID=4558 RepID=A0A1B6Q416_SORBI|nr:hypothetical protein SORBI_3003G180200 [Sorghum bicolor]
MLGLVGGESVERYCRLASCDRSSPTPAVPSRTTGERSGDSAGDAFAVVIPLQLYLHGGQGSTSQSPRTRSGYKMSIGETDSLLPLNPPLDSYAQEPHGAVP